jgi:hypothetical protein
MKWLPIALPLLVLLTVVPARAESPDSTKLKFNGTISAGELTPTPDMWFYEQYLRQQQDPSFAVRQKAEFRSNQRQDRIAARRWFGFSNLRPTAGTELIHGDAGPRWTSTNSAYPNRWAGASATMVVRPTTTKTY